MRIAGTIFSLYLVCFCFSQEKTDFPFVKKELNYLSFPSDSSEFMNLYDRLSSLRNENAGRVTIVHLGGSHVQAGIWSNSFATTLQNKAGTIGGGYFVFPYKMAKTNGQYFFNSFSTGTWKRCRAISHELCQPLGMSGISVATRDSLVTFGGNLTSKAFCRYVNRVSVYHDFNSAYELKLTYPLTAVSRTDEPAKGFSIFEFATPIDSFRFEARRLDSAGVFAVYGYNLENTLSAGIYLAALGVNGAASGSFLRCDLLRKQLAQLKPDLCVLSFGVNDVQTKKFARDTFTSNYDSLVDLLREANPHTCIILCTTSDNYIKRKTPNKRTEEARQAIFSMRDKKRVAVWDLYGLMGGFKSITRWLAAGYAQKDRIHFSSRGYVLLGELMADALFKSSSAYHAGH